jgi:hypothetical protein
MGFDELSRSRKAVSGTEPGDVRAEGLDQLIDAAIMIHESTE